MPANEIGQQTYQLCGACHGPDAKGVSPLGPPLAENQWVNGPAENLIKIQFRGIQGPIHPQEGVEWKESPMMAPNAYLSDEQLSAVLTYIRSNFGNDAPAVTVEEVKALRGEIGKPMLTEADLTPLPKKVIEVKPAEENKLVKDGAETVAAGVFADPPSPSNSTGLPLAAWGGLIAWLAIIALSVVGGIATRNK